MLRPLLYGLIALLGCASSPVTTTPNLGDVRTRVAARDVAWIDTMPILRMPMPYVYAMLRAEMEQCSGLSRDGWPEFFIAPLNPIYTKVGPAAAIYVHASNTIVFALGSETVPWIIRHEIGHFLLNKPGAGHPPEVFGADSPCAPLLRP